MISGIAPQQTDSEDAFCRIATDGTFLYIHCERGLFKVGTGFHCAYLTRVCD